MNHLSKRIHAVCISQSLKEKKSLIYSTSLSVIVIMIFNFQFSEKDGIFQKSSQKEIGFYTGMVSFISLPLYYVIIQSLSSMFKLFNTLQSLTASLHYVRQCLVHGLLIYTVFYVHIMYCLFAGYCLQENWTSSSMLLLHTSALYLCLPSRVTSPHNSLCSCLFILCISTDFIIVIL